MTRVAPAADWQQADDTWCMASAAPWRPGPRCRHRRVRHGGRFRYCRVTGAGTGVPFRLRVQRVRCRTCRTVETLYPPWRWPYLLGPVPPWVELCEARWMSGATGTAVAAQAGVDAGTVRRRWRAWKAHWVLWRQQALQHAATWGVVVIEAVLFDAPALTSPGADWQARVAGWSVIAVAGGWPGIPPLVAWITGAPLVVPAPLVAPHTHWGRQLRGAGGPP